MQSAVKLPDQPHPSGSTTHKQLLINGRWVDAASGKTIETRNPATGEVLATIAAGDKEDVDKAVTAARAAFESGPWKTMTPAERGKLMWRFADLFEKHLDELSELETLDNGKPIWQSKVIEVPLAIDHFRYMAGWATKIEGHTIPVSVPYAPDAKFLAYSLREPVGVVGQIVPWNAPLVMAAWKLAPALAAGCTCILKPAEDTSLTALRLGELFLEAGFPEGVVNIVTGYGETAGAAIAAHPGIDKVAFTGSTEVGRSILQAAGSNLKKVSLELGGKSPNVVFADADLEQAIPGSAQAVFFNQGEICVSAARLYVERSVYDRVLEEVSKTAAGIKLGNPMEPSTQMGPLISETQLNRVCNYLQVGAAEGARTVTGGKRHGTQGYFVEPTVLVDADANSRIMQEEIFGPVLSVVPFENMDDLIPKLNNTVYGLGAGVWTRDIKKVHAVSSNVRAGTVWVNCYHIFDSALPFGGYKQSGWGRECGREALELYTEVKTVINMM